MKGSLNNLMKLKWIRRGDCVRTVVRLSLLLQSQWRPNINRLVWMILDRPLVRRVNQELC